MFRILQITSILAIKPCRMSDDFEIFENILFVIKAFD